MRLRLLLSALALLAAVAVAHASSTFAEAAERLDGEWRGGDFVLRIDAKRAQASVDGERPFAWERFLVRDVTPTEIVFAVGDELYEARLESDSLTLTGTSFRGERLLFRSQQERPVILELRR
jgi:hypothetical protein